jgi:hypothetical protein
LRGAVPALSGLISRCFVRFGLVRRSGAGPGLAALAFGRCGCWGLSGEFDGECFEFGDELAQAAVGGEVGAEPFGVFGGEGLGDGAGAGFAGPGG